MAASRQHDPLDDVTHALADAVHQLADGFLVIVPAIPGEIDIVARDQAGNHYDAKHACQPKTQLLRSQVINTPANQCIIHKAEGNRHPGTGRTQARSQE